MCEMTSLSCKISKAQKILLSCSRLEWMFVFFNFFEHWQLVVQPKSDHEKRETSSRSLWRCETGIPSQRMAAWRLTLYLKINNVIHTLRCLSKKFNITGHLTSMKRCKDMVVNLSRWQRELLRPLVLTKSFIKFSAPKEKK